MPVHDADGAVAELAATQHGAFTRSQAAERGMTTKMIRARLAAGVLREPFPRVLVLTSVPTSWQQSMKAATLVRPGRVVASVRGAAGLHALDGCPAEFSEVHTLPDLRLRLPGFVVHRVASLDRCDVVNVGGIPATNLARTLADLGSVLSRDEVERALDDARRRGASLRWLRETATRLHRPGQSGTTVLLSLLDAITPDQRVRGSWFEALVERCFESPRLPPLLRQFEIRDLDGRLAGIVDLAFPDIKLAVEGHSKEFHFGARPERRDEDRDLRLAALGWHVLYVGWQHTKSPQVLLEVVESAARERMLVVSTTNRSPQ